ncbi:hypothetical protein PoB_002432000 [Plakobranchus ocellatus]|uniref:Uncharacterized protein n=1 Tax=Plakobranchus ocellatus TaxID=259542 RepID=A0AAV3ZRN4_9GAST|nr:hypothetical protein PoB_002432000 [Plakobranchus ocellatus]
MKSSQIISGCFVQKAKGKGPSYPLRPYQLAKTCPHVGNDRRLLTTSSTGEQDPPPIHTPRPALTKHRQGAQQNYHHSKQVTPPAQKCRNCRGSWPHVGGQNKCPAFNTTYRNCSKLHHFASVCKSAPAKPSRFSNKRKTIRNIQESSELDHDAESTDEDPEYIFHTNPASEKLPRLMVMSND